MEDMNHTDFTEIISKIEKKEIVLPDFQREFVWKSEEEQCKLVASVLARMPIGSILLLKSRHDEYASKIIGCSKEQDMSDVNGEVEFLLDGQQRITVLANVFSSIIHELCPKVSELSAPIALKRRFFLRIPKWKKIKEERDLFGVHDLVFKYDNTKNDSDFLSSDIYSFIECLSFKTGETVPYNPHTELDTDLDNFCMSYEKGYLIPLYLLAPSKLKNDSQVKLRYEAIINKVADGIHQEILNYFSGLEGDEKKKKFVEEIFTNNLKEKICNNIALFEKELKDKSKLWEMGLKDYLRVCTQEIVLNRIIVNADKRARAIDIYENLNRGGVSLSTFDLIMARVATVSNKNFFKRIIDNMLCEKGYTKDVLNDTMQTLLGKKINTKSYNATVNMKCYKEQKNEINPKYIDVFLDVLSLYCNNKDFMSDKYKIENIKRDKILSLNPKDINENCELVCNAIDRALFFFQTRCGIRNINEINYSLLLVIVSIIFINEEWFKDKKIHNILEAWYWAVVFSGEFDKDQNSKMISNLQLMIKTINREQDVKWIENIKEYVLNTPNFSDKDLLLLEKADDERYPKDVIRNFICQYFLSKTYADMFDSDKEISVFCKEADELEAHHIIPLGSAKKVGEVTAKLRKEKKHICNSPLNFIYITKQSNKEISDESLKGYADRLCNEAKTKLYISKYSTYESGDSEDKIKKILAERFEYLKGDITGHIKTLIS